MQVMVTILHVVACIVLILVVLLQAGKGANMGAAFGGSSQTVFGSTGAGTFLGKMTTAVAVMFMFTSFFLSYTASHREKSLLDNASRPAARRSMPQPAQKQTLPPGPPTAGETGKVPVSIPPK
jgi:preprotein translocase subunit SecG